MVPPDGGARDVMEFTRAQETEPPQALKWQLARADEEYDPAVVGRRATATHDPRTTP